MEKYIYKFACFFVIFTLFSLITSKNDIKVYENKVKILGGSIATENIVFSSDIELSFVETYEHQSTDEYEEYRLTSFWANDELDTTSCTGSGLCEDDFSINDRGWYTYEDKIVLAAATYECLNADIGACSKWNQANDDKTYYNYYDEVSIIIDDVEYDGVVLDSCGACMYVSEEQRLDLFISDSNYSIDRGYNGDNSALVYKEEG